MGSEQKRAFLAVALSAVVLFGWQAMFGTQTIQTPQDVSGSNKQNQAVWSNTQATLTTNTDINNPSNTAQVPVNIEQE